MSDQDLRVRQLAYRIWESEGRPTGAEQRHWDMALRIVEAERGQDTPVDELPLDAGAISGAEEAPMDERGPSDYGQPEGPSNPAQAPISPGTPGSETVAQAEEKSAKPTRARKSAPTSPKPGAAPKRKPAGRKPKSDQ